VARDVSVGKNSPLKIFFVKGNYDAAQYATGPNSPKNPTNDMWFSYKFGIHDFALYKWKGKGFNIDTKINKTDNTPEAVQEIKGHASQAGSGVVYVYADAESIYYQDLKGVLNRSLSTKKTTNRKRKVPGTASARNHAPAASARISATGSFQYPKMISSSHAGSSKYHHPAPPQLTHHHHPHHEVPGHTIGINVSSMQVLPPQSQISPAAAAAASNPTSMMQQQQQQQSQENVINAYRNPHRAQAAMAIQQHQGNNNPDIMPSNTLVAREFSADLFNGTEFGDMVAASESSSQLLHDDFFQPAPMHSMPPTMGFSTRSLRSNTTMRDDLKGIRAIDGVVSINNVLESNFFRRGATGQNILDTNLSNFYNEKFLGPFDFFTVFNYYKSRNFAMYKFNGPTTTPLSLNLQKEKGITICAIWHSKTWHSIRKNSKKDGEKAIDLFLDAHNTRIMDGDILMCIVKPTVKEEKTADDNSKDSATAHNVVLEREGGKKRVLSLVRRQQPGSDLHQLLRHLVLRLLACLHVVQIPKEYDGKALKNLGLQNEGLTIWSIIKKQQGESIETYVNGDTKLERGFCVVVKKSTKDANMEDKCYQLSRGELGWVDDEDS